MSFKLWLDWYHRLDTIQQQAVNHYNKTGELWTLPFFWHALPDPIPLPEDFCEIWQEWYRALSTTEQLSINAYFKVGNPRLLLFVWRNLLDHAQQFPEVSIP